MITYIKLLLHQKRYNYKFHKIILLKDIIKYFFFSILILQNVLYLASPIDISINPEISQFILSGKLLLLVICSAIFLSHFSIRITRLLSAEPFWRFNSNNEWFIKSYVFPLFSSSLGMIFFTLTSIFHWRGMFYFLIFYLTYLFSYKSIALRITLLTVLMGNYLLGLSEMNVFLLSGASLILLIAFDRLKLNFSRSKKIKDFSLPLIESNVINKEFKYYKYYTSEIVYSVIGLGICLYLIILIYRPDFVREYGFSMWVYLCITQLPFTMSLFNLFGMDTNVVTRYFRDAENTINYQIRRFRVYQLPIHVLNLVILSSFFIKFHNLKMIFTYSLALIAFNEFVLFTAILISIFFIECKEKKWRYGQYLLSKNVNSMAFVLSVYLVLLLFAHNFLGMPGIIFLTVISICLNAFSLKPIALNLIENQKMKGFDFVK